MRARLLLWPAAAAALSVRAPPALRRLRADDESAAFLGASHDASFLKRAGVPAFAADGDDWVALADASAAARSREDVAGVDGAFVVRGVLDADECAALIGAAEACGFGSFEAGKNSHAALQIACRPDSPAVRELSARLAPHAPRYIDGHAGAGEVSARLRFYRYAADGAETFAPHVDAGFPGGGLDASGEMAFDAHDGCLASRLTVLLYLNEAFEGGETVFYGGSKLEDRVAAVKPATGAALCFPQAVGEAAMDAARREWCWHEGARVEAGEPKYVIRTDLLYYAEVASERDPHAAAVRRAFAPASYGEDAFLRAARGCYGPHMGVERAAPVLRSLVGFLKPRRILEVGAGYTSLHLLRALQENDEDLARIRRLQRSGRCELLEWPWTVQDFVEEYDAVPAKLVCIDNCAHETESASSVSSIAADLGLDGYLDFIKGDAWDMEDLYASESFDLFWLDFGVGEAVGAFVEKVWPAIVPGGYLICHSTLTNQHTRVWLDAVRRREPRSVTGIDPDHVQHVSFLEPHKRFQNALTILQKRPPGYAEPLYSECA